MPLLAGLASRATWEAASLGDLLVGGAPHLDLGAGEAATRAAARLSGLRRTLHATLVERRALEKPSPACQPLRQALDAYLDDLDAGELPAPPFAAHALAGAPCLGLDAALVDEVHFLTIAADDAQSLFVAAATAERVVLQWFSAADALVVRGRRVYVVAVPRWSVVTARSTRRDTGQPATWHGFVTRDQTVWDRPPAAGCLRVSALLDEGAALLLDGRPLAGGLRRRALGVLAGAHELVALSCPQGQDTACHVRFRETLAEEARTTTANLCQDIEIDLRRQDSLAVLGASSAPGCDQAMSWQASAIAADYLRRDEARSGRSFRDLKAYASLTDGLAALKTSLQPAAGQSVGARTGADSLDLLGTAAREAWRQGIDELLSFELRCGAGGYTLEGTAIAVREVFGRGLGGVAGLDLRRLLRVESVRFAGPAQLESAVLAVIDRLLGRDDLRFREGPRVFGYRQRARLELLAEARAAGERRWQPTVEAYHLADPQRGAPEVCAQLERGRHVDIAALAESTLAALAPARSVRVSVERSVDADATDTRASFRAGRPGTYLVLARWPASAGAGAIGDATCVRFEVPDAELWGSLAFAPDLTTLTGIRELQMSHIRVHLGHTWYRPLPWLGFGVFGGYTFSNYVSRAGLPSWQDTSVDPAGSNERFQWHRHGVMIGPVIEARTRQASWPVELRGRLVVGLGGAITRVDDAAESYPDFVTAERFNANGLRLSPLLDVVLDLGIGYAIGPVHVGHSVMLGALAVNDMLAAQAAATALNGSGLVLGLGLTLGGSP